MRPVQLLLSAAASFLALSMILYLAVGRDAHTESRAGAASTTAKGRFKTLWSFTSPGSLFPPSAIISLTDDNSTFFLARPAAFGPPLPEKGLSGPLWVGAGFGEDAMHRGELGCSDVPGWSEEQVSGINVEATPSVTLEDEHSEDYSPSEPALHDEQPDDGTDDHLLPSSSASRPRSRKTSDHADIQSLQEGAEIDGKVVLLKRGGCGFLAKVKWAQKRGGTAVIVGDNVRGGGLIRMYARGDTSNITIPSVFTSHTTAHLLSSLAPSGLSGESLSPREQPTLEHIKSGKGAKIGKDQTKAKESHAIEKEPTLGPHISKKNPASSPEVEVAEGAGESGEAGLFASLLETLGFAGNRRPARPVYHVKEATDGNSRGQSPLSTKAASKHAATPIPDNFVIGEQDWRDPDMLPTTASTFTSSSETALSEPSNNARKGGSLVPGSGEYTTSLEEAKQKDHLAGEQPQGWLGSLLDGNEEDETTRPEQQLPNESDTPFKSAEESDEIKRPEHHEGLWVTISPTTMSSSPFFDTLLVLVVSPLVTLTVVYCLLFLRSRIRRRRWRAPKSVVDRLPVRTYHTISDSSSSSATTSASANVTTPLLQHSRSRPTSSESRSSRPSSRTASDVPATSSAFQPSSVITGEEKGECGLTEWRRRGAGRQKECVVCLEEYVDGVSQVMSLPCGHEFHAECITPWLVTRRRTCPICKGDVVRDLSRSYHNRHNNRSSASPNRARRFSSNMDDLQVQAAESRNDAPSSSRPVDVHTRMDSEGRIHDDYSDDIEANWADDPLDGDDNPGSRSELHQDFIDLSSSVRELSESVRTVIWRGVDAVRDAVGLQRRGSRDEEVDRDR